MKTIRILLILLLCSIDFCEAKKPLNLDSEEGREIAAIETLLRNNQYQIEITTVTPLRQKAEAVEGNNFIIVNKEVAQVHLPYKGRLMESGNITSENLRFDGVVYKYKFQQAKKNYSWFINFKVIDGRNESYHFTVKLFRDMRCEISMSSAVRSSIKYEGRLIPLPEVKK